MEEINDEIKLTLNLMQTDIDDGAHGELQSHLYSLLEIKRNELQQRLVERSRSEPVTHDAKPLTPEELKAGSWCAESSEECRKALIEKGLVTQYAGLPSEDGYKYCNLAGDIILMTPMMAHNAALKQIRLIGNEFYWSEK